VFSFIGGDYCTNTVPYFYHTLSVYGVLCCALLLVITTSAQKVFSFKLSYQFTVVEQLDSFEVDVLENPFFMLLSELSSFIRNHFHLNVPMEVGVFDIPRCINDVPKHIVTYTNKEIRISYCPMSRAIQ